jgi:hypothetical protein
MTSINRWTLEAAGASAWRTGMRDQLAQAEVTPVQRGVIFPSGCNPPSETADA